MSPRSTAAVVVTFVAVVAIAALLPRRVAAEGTGQLIVSLTPDSGMPASRTRTARKLGPGRGLLDGIPWIEPSLNASRPRRSAADRRDFDPARVWLIDAADSAAAAALATQLVRDGIAEWAEPAAAREACDMPAWRLPIPSGCDATALRVAGRSGGFPDDPVFRDGRQWGLFNDGSRGGTAGADIHALEAWQASTGAPWLRLAVIDTGIDAAQPDLQQSLPTGNRIENGLNVTAETSRSWADSAAHGTAVAGVMAALTNDGPHFDSLGIAGVCGGDGVTNPGCHIVPIKVAPGHSTSASSFDIARGIFAAVAAGARAVNVSFGGAASSRLEREAMRYAIEHNCLVVAASGNRGAVAPREAVYPAAYAALGFCAQVGATDAWDRRAAFSSYGPGLSFVAPGVDIWTTFLTHPSAAGAMYPGYVAVSGTSFAAPFATGVAGLLASARPELLADDLLELMRRGARDIGDPGPEAGTGAGMLDAAASLRAIAPGIGIWHDEFAATEWFDAGVDSLVVGEGGFGNLSGPRTWSAARRIEARITVTLPDSFTGAVTVWPRVAGTSTVRGDYRLPCFAPHAEVAWIDGRTFALTGWLYRIAAASDSIDLPLPFDQARFSITVLGPVRRPWLSSGKFRGDPGLHASPNPFRSVLHIDTPRGAGVELFDIGGRRVRSWPVDGSVSTIDWDGRDAIGSSVPPGLYWVRAHTTQGFSQLRVIKLE